MDGAAPQRVENPPEVEAAKENRLLHESGWRDIQEGNSDTDIRSRITAG